MQKKKKINLKVRRVSGAKKTKKDIESIDLSENDKPSLGEKVEKREDFSVEDLIDSKKNALLEEARKRKIMWAGVVFAMLLVVFVWGYTLKKSFADNDIKSGGEEFSFQAWSDITKEIDSQLENLKNDIKEINDNASAAGSTTEAVLLPQAEDNAESASSSEE